MGALEGQVALVTGGSRGIGRACVLALAREGAAVVINYATSAEAAHTARAEVESAGGRALVVRADVSEVAQARALIASAEEALGRVDILVNNAGIAIVRTIQRLTAEEWDRVIQTDLSSAFYCTNAAIPGMRERGYGRIVNMASLMGQMGDLGQAAYSAAKAGMIAFTKSAAKELGRHGITVNAVCPGYIETEMSGTMPEDYRQSLLAQMPLGRFGTAEEVAETVVFLCKPSGAFYTGAQLSLNGGHYM